MRSIEEIYQALLEAYAERAGFKPEEGCDLAVRFWSAAAQLQSLEVQADWVLDQSFPQTAQGVYLDYHGAMRGLERAAATHAEGTIRFTVEAAPVSNMTIPEGTVCMTADEVRFQTTKAVVLSAGKFSADAPAKAVESGRKGNVVAGTVTILTACPVAVTGCTNPAAFSGGSDAESDEAYRSRILESYLRLPNGANAAWYEQTAMNWLGVAAATAVGRARGTGTVDVYVATESGIPDAALLEALRAEFQEKREIAVDVAVKAPVTRTVNVAVAVTPAEGMEFATVKTAVEREIRAVFTGRLLSKPVRLAALGSRIYALDGVENYRFSAPAADVAAEDAVLPVLGTLTITELEA